MSTAPRFYVRALSAFFAFGACASGFSFLTLLLPGGPLDVLWRVNPTGHAALQKAGAMGVILMAVVCVVCAVTARGLWLRRRWGHRLALAMLGMNLTADLVNGLLLGDRRTLIGIPIAGAMIVYLLSPRVRAVFQTSGSQV
jgi:uncharacterized membrane protein (DUF2068 family)